MNRKIYYVYKNKEQEHLAKTLEMIVGTCSLDFIKESQAIILAREQTDDECLFLIGKITQESLQRLKENVSTATIKYLVTGVNLSILLETLMNLENQTFSLKKFAEHLTLIGKESIQTLNQEALK